jgi:hypothetical protein
MIPSVMTVLGGVGSHVNTVTIGRYFIVMSAVLRPSVKRICRP